ncbi:NAD-dependent epimerase/dehydratase family protein [Agrococcus casei]|uniref:UDP-glucose 4-epimerase n=1 Tax=Agrococcus casei LMG 22410 TaxID=1255656 RepID=A0A1R4EYP9_9MICO|nr:NAD(P)-dependent oxidoreductase [Agrococcus casei]SJM48774.1 UDP-glucose 4-epimerase [Agrococcus casei LMG 22410]
MKLSESTWALTGADGSIGRVLRRHLRDRVQRLVVADLQAPADPADNEVSLAFDVTDPASITPVVAGVDGVIHLAAVPDEAPYEALLRVNALGTHNLLEAMRTQGVRHLVYASSNRATGFHPVDAMLDDQSTIRPDGLYGASKAAVEALTRLYADKFGLRVCNLRIGSFKAAPVVPRDAATWLSPGDMTRAFEAAMTAEQPFSVFYGVSANRHRFWSLEPGHAVGYTPLDDASDILGADVQPSPHAPQAGAEFSSQEFTLRSMR